MFLYHCKEDDNSWLEVMDQVDREGMLHIAINEMILDVKGEMRIPYARFKEQCVYMPRDRVEELISHLQDALSNPNF
jgi:hypothetical protein